MTMSNMYGLFNIGRGPGGPGEMSTGHHRALSYLCTAAPCTRLLPQEALGWASSGKASAPLGASPVKAHMQSHIKGPAGGRNAF